MIAQKTLSAHLLTTCWFNWTQALHDQMINVVLGLTWHYLDFQRGLLYWAQHHIMHLYGTWIGSRWICRQRCLQGFCNLSQVAILFTWSVRVIAIQISVVHTKQPAPRVAKLETKEVSSCNKDCYLYLAQFSDEAVWRLQQVGGNTKSGLTICGRGDKASYEVEDTSSQ